MRGPFRDNNFVITYDGLDADSTRPLPLFASSFADAKREGDDFARRNRIDPSAIRVFYRVQVTAFTEWVEVGEDTDYEEVVAALYRDFRP